MLKYSFCKLLFVFSVLFPFFLFASSFKDKIQASVLGAATGDAWGRPVEFIETTEGILHGYPGGIQSFEDLKESDFLMDEKGNRVAPYTDDTAMAFLVFEVLKRQSENGWDLNKTMSEMARAFVEDKNYPNGWAAIFRAPGKTCKKKVEELKGRLLVGRDKIDAHWWNVGEPGMEGGGCGSVMRAYPFGLIFFQDPEKAKIWAAEHSKLTHGDPIALAACAALAVATAYAVQGKEIDFIAQEAQKAAAEYDEKTSKMVAEAYILAQEHKKFAQSPQQLFHLAKPVFKKWEGWAAHDAIAASLYIFFVLPHDLKKALWLGVLTPGDSDSIASIAGALVGAYGGMQLFKDINLGRLEGKENIEKLVKETVEKMPRV